MTRPSVYIYPKIFSHHKYSGLLSRQVERRFPLPLNAVHHTCRSNFLMQRADWVSSLLSHKIFRYIVQINIT